MTHSKEGLKPPRLYPKLSISQEMPNDLHCPFTQHGPGHGIKEEEGMTATQGSPRPPLDGRSPSTLQRVKKTHSSGVQQKTNLKKKKIKVIRKTQHRMGCGG